MAREIARSERDESLAFQDLLHMAIGAGMARDELANLASEVILP